NPTGIPISARRLLSHCELVSRFCPLVSSLPTEMISAFMGVTTLGARARLARIARQFDAHQLDPPGEAGATPALPGSHEPAFGLEALFATCTTLLQEFGHGPVGQRRTVL